jgi:hypothetical protein
MLTLLVGGVALLDDAHHSAGLVLGGGSHHTAVAGGIVHDGTGQGGGVSVRHVCGDQLRQRLGAQQRRVAGQDEHRRVVVQVVTGDGGHADHGCVAGAALDGLLDEADVGPRGRLFLHLLGDPFGAVTDHQHRALDVQVLECVDDVHDHGPAADHVERLGPGRTHPRALAGGEHDCRNTHVSVLSQPSRRALACSLAPGRGFEPLYAAPKTAVLPLNDPGRTRRGYRRVLGATCPDSRPADDPDDAPDRDFIWFAPRCPVASHELWVH